MIISDTHNFIFVHNYKVAGSSIRKALQPYKTFQIDRLNWFDRQLARLGLREIPKYPPLHATALEIRGRFPEEWEEYFTFGFVRNPWSWQVSLYFFMLQNEGHPFHENVKAMDGFEEYIEWRVREECILQSSFFCDEKGSFIVDFIGKLENIKKDFEKICGNIGVEESLPHKNKSNHKHYSNYYNKHTKNLVKNNFKKDIQNFDYSFENKKG